MSVNRQIHLVSRPDPATGPSTANFALREAPVPQPGAGQVLLQTLYLSLDPYMRARMYEGANYAANAALNAPMVGATVSRVIASRNPGFVVGDIVESGHGWQEYALSDGTGLRRIDPSLAPISTALGVLGMPGQTGYTALLRHRLQEQNGLIARRQHELEQARLRVSEKHRETKVLEKHREQQFGIYLQDMERDMQREMDESAGNMGNQLD